MRELVDDAAAEGQDTKAIANGAAAGEGKEEEEGKTLVEAEVESIRQKTASFLLGEGRWEKGFSTV